MKKALILIIILLLYTNLFAQKDKGNNIDSLNKKAFEHYYYEKDSAYFYFDKVTRIAKKEQKDTLLIESFFNSTGVANYHYDLKKIKHNLAQLDSLIPSNSNKKSDNYNILLYYKGGYYLKLFKYEASKKCFENIITNSNTFSDSNRSDTMNSLTSAAYGFLGKIYMYQGKLDQALDLYEKNIREIKSNPNPNLENLYANYNLLAEVLMKKKEYAAANKYWLQAFKFNKKNSYPNSIITNAYNIAENYGYQLKKDSALHYLFQAKKYFNNKPIFYPKYHLKKANIHKNNWEYEVAQTEIDSAITLVNANFKNQKSADLVLAYHQKGLIYHLLQQHDKATAAIDLGIQKSLNNAKEDIYAVKLYKTKALILNDQGGEKNYKRAINTVALASELLDRLKPGFKSAKDKLLLVEDAFPLFESGIEANYKLYETTKDESFIEKGFVYSEKSKSALLLEALLSSQATEFSNIPNKILEKENQLKSEIIFTEKLLQKQNKDSILLKNNLFNLKQENRTLAETIENEYPSYYDLKYNSKIISLTHVQDKLTENELLVSYFYGNNAIYLIATTLNKKYFEKIALSSQVTTDIKEVHAMLSDPKSDIKVLSKLSNKLYQELLESVLKQFKKEKLIIIPDGVLNYIPFGSLVTNIEQQRYLIADKTISYINSATLWDKLNSKKLNQNKLLAFAPSFPSTTGANDQRSGLLGSLPHNKKEAEYINTFFNGKSFIDKEATLQNFNASAPKYSIFHLATHAVFNDLNPEFSYLAFTPQLESEDLLYVKDLYNLTLNANLVTLSACESGIGDLKRGEGFISLARGFFYSGASSITSTLWRVNDNSSSLIMKGFYENLAQGTTKDKSLQLAKLSFLEKNHDNGLAHPYYWSGYIAQGNMSALTSNINWWWCFSAVLIIAIIFICRKFLL